MHDATTATFCLRPQNYVVIPMTYGKASARRMARQGDSIGQRLRSRRLALALSQDAVAEAIGVSQVQVAKYEKGENQVPIDKIGLLVDVLQIDVIDLLGLEPRHGAPSPWAADIARKLDSLPPPIKRDLAALIDDLFDRGAAQ